MTRTQLIDRLRRAEARMDRCETDAEYEAARQLYVVARFDLEQHDWKLGRAA
jgi:hypothetical protein